jgi:signal transduction histidine kinase
VCDASTAIVWVPVHGSLAEPGGADRAPDRSRRREPDLLNHVAHELNGPLTYLLGYSELLLDGQLDAAATRAAQVEIYRETCRLMDLVGIMLEAAPGGRARPTADDRSFELRHLLERVAHRWRTAHPQLQLATECASDAWIVGNPDRIALALHALLGLSIDSSDQSRTPATLRVAPAGSDWRIQVERSAPAPSTNATTARLVRQAIDAIAAAHGGRVRTRSGRLALFLPARPAATAGSNGGS